MVIDHRTVRHRMGTKQASQIVWFRNDLRISDHQALDKALENCQPGQEVKALYVYDSEEQEWGHYQVGWLKRSLHALEISLQTLGIKLWVRHGDTTTEVLQFCQEHTAEGIYWHRRYLPKQQTLDKKIKEALNSITCESFSGYLCLEPWHILNKSGLPFKVFTITSGVINYNLPVFFLICLFTRGLRFFLVAYLTSLFGQKFGKFIEKKGALWFTIGGIFIVILAIVLYIIFT